MRQKALFIKGPLADLGDVARVAAEQGKQVLKSKDVIVKPVLHRFEDGYLVVVESHEDSGCKKASVVEVGKKYEA